MFKWESNKSKLQKSLDRERQTAQVAEECHADAPAARTPEGSKPLFKKRAEPGKVFQVDLLNGWAKP